MVKIEKEILDEEKNNNKKETSLRKLFESFISAIYCVSKN